ncbi:MAG TPA: TIGR04283 family arsenosugar biosynthesis glycosyltransferase [Burkholderiales bacterium]|nr:TIGR04283 family arsenosugar biosynthesis glycosyltransferase [Burkholderiales bacterium]
MITLSIVVPALGEAAGIGRSLALLAPLRARGCEVILVDGGSHDGTLLVAAPLADRVLVAIRGRASQMNAGASVARGEVLLFLHADSEPPPDADRLIAEGLARSGRVWGRFDARLSGAHPLLRIVERAMNWRSRVTGICTGDQGIFVRRDVFERIGGYPPIALMEDIALSRELRRTNPPLCLTAPILTSSRRWERNGVLRTVLAMWRLRLMYFLGADPARLARDYEQQLV